MSRTTPKLITRAQAAERAGVNVRTIDRLRQSGFLDTYKRRGERTVYVDQDQLDLATKPMVVVPAQRTGAQA
jgi:predicted site-specific integrase-resolvase